MYRVPAEEPGEPGEAYRLPVQSLASWLTIVFLAVVTLAMVGGLALVRRSLTMDEVAPPPPPPRVSARRG